TALVPDRFRNVAVRGGKPQAVDGVPEGGVVAILGKLGAAHSSVKRRRSQAVDAQSARCWRQARIVTSRGAVVAAGDKNADPLRRRLLPESVIKSVAAQKLLLTQSETYAHDRRQIVVHNVGRGEVYAVCGSSGTAHHQVHSGPWSHGACPLHVQRGFYRV